MFKRAILFVMCCAILGSANPSEASNAPHRLNYQGQLSDSIGNPLDTIVDIAFRMYHDLTGGIDIWSETQQNIIVIGGLFNLQLGGINPLPDSLFIDTSLYLGITIGNDPELTPRMSIAASPYSIRIQTIDGAYGGTINGDVTVVGKATIGENNSNTGDFGFVAGTNDTVTGQYSTVDGGNNNRAGYDYATVGGGGFNIADGYFSTIAGGRSNSAGSGYQNAYGVVGGGINNIVSALTATVAGGRSNNASAISATISGGEYNAAGGEYASVGGGMSNVAAGPASTIPGGRYNEANAYDAFAAGQRAKAIHSGCFVWGDGTNQDISSTAINQFTIRSSGGVRIFTNENLTAGVTLAPGASAWAQVSDSAAKRNIRFVNGAEILARLVQMPIYRWSYKAQDENIEHIGPMAQDFYEAFSVGDDNKTISTIDPDGIALSAIKELARRVEELEYLKRELRELRREVDILRQDRQVTVTDNASLKQ